MNETEIFLGSKKQRVQARIIYKSVHGLYGGHYIFIGGNNSVCIQKINDAIYEYRYKFQLPEAETEKIFQTMINNNFNAIDIKPRSGAPDESDELIILKNYLFKKNTKVKWINDKHNEFNNIAIAIKKIIKNINNDNLVYQGKFNFNLTSQ